MEGIYFQIKEGFVLTENLTKDELFFKLHKSVSALTDEYEITKALGLKVSKSWASIEGFALQTEKSKLVHGNLCKKSSDKFLREFLESSNFLSQRLKIFEYNMSLLNLEKRHGDDLNEVETLKRLILNYENFLLPLIRHFRSQLGSISTELVNQQVIAVKETVAKFHAPELERVSLC